MTLIVRIIALIFLLPFIGLGQEICIDNNPLFERLYTDTNSISAIDNHEVKVQLKFLKFNDKQIASYTQRLIKSKNKLYIVIDGTGRVYQATSSSKEKICFTRIDSTYFIGYNGNAIIFEQNDTLFSFGGGGFWRTNGQLRYFSKQNHEWNIFKINCLSKLIKKTSHLYYRPSN